MTAGEAHRYAKTLVLPALLDLVGISGQLREIENRENNPIAKALDMVGGVDFWVETADRRLVPIASRVQSWEEDGINRRSFTIRLGESREAGKRVRAIADGGLIPEWTAQGYITAAKTLACAGIITTRELFAAFVEAESKPDFRPRINGYDGTPFWCGYWQTLERYGHATTLRIIEGVRPAPRPFCSQCRSHFCPHAAPHLYRPPFTRNDESTQALTLWDEAQT